MLDPDFDPLAQLVSLQTQINQLTANNQQLVTALNHQANALKLISAQVVTINTTLLQLDNQQKIINGFIGEQIKQGQ